MSTQCGTVGVMHNTTGSAALVIDPWARYAAWCGQCGATTESDDTTCQWCAECGGRRRDHE